jgi:hypothetical protein
MDYVLSIANIEFLKREIGSSGLTYSHLRHDLIDHVCCDVEYEMLNGLPFEKAYDRVKQKIGMGGLERIQHETLYLIDKKYRIMKKTMKISGVVAPIILAFGTLFKIEQWPAAGILMVLGFFLLSFIFLPSAIYVSYKEVSNQTKKWTHFVGFFGTFFLSLSFLFKIMHWPGAWIAMMVGVTLICLVFLPMVLINKVRDKQIFIPKYIYVLGFIGLMLYLIAFLFKVMHWPGAAMFMLMGGLLLVFIAFPLYAIKTYKEQTAVANSFIYMVIALVWFVVPITLLSLNISTDVLKPTYETNSYLYKDIKFVEERNQNLLEQLNGSAQAVSLNKCAVTLNEFIKNVQVDMVKISSTNRDSESEFTSEKEIDVNKIHSGSDFGFYNQILFYKNNRGEKLKDLLRTFENEALSISSNSSYVSAIKNTLAFEIKPSNEALLFSLNKLSFIQLNILIAEQTALNQLIIGKQVEVK